MLAGANESADRRKRGTERGIAIFALFRVGRKNGGQAGCVVGLCRQVCRVCKKSRCGMGSMPGETGRMAEKGFSLQANFEGQEDCKVV